MRDSGEAIEGGGWVAGWQIKLQNDERYLPVRGMDNLRGNGSLILNKPLTVAMSKIP